MKSTAISSIFSKVNTRYRHSYSSYVIKCSIESFEIGGAEVKGRDGSEAAAALSPEELSCPSENVISTRYRCKVSRSEFVFPLQPFHRGLMDAFTR